MAALAAIVGSEGWGRGESDVVAELAEAVDEAVSLALTGRGGEGRRTKLVVGDAWVSMCQDEVSMEAATATMAFWGPRRVLSR